MAVIRAESAVPMTRRRSTAAVLRSSSRPNGICLETTSGWPSGMMATVFTSGCQLARSNGIGVRLECFSFAQALIRPFR